MTEADFVRNTRTSYDAMATAYNETYRHTLRDDPMERAMLAVFAEQVDGPVADLGCGNGRITGHLKGLGLDVFGVDLSPGMLAIARAQVPGVDFREGSLLALDLPDGSLGGLVAWYSIIHTPRELLPEVFAEFRRVLAPGGRAAVAFQTGTEAKHYEEGFGARLDLTFYRNDPDEIAALLTKAGLDVRSTTVRQAERDEPTGQAYLMATG
ncbi:MAG: methyltransferase domain-containing protein [Nonomuraea sp.]|nr:methyltransferase domain-containing protein [Nonomuraea sp.]